MYELLAAFTGVLACGYVLYYLWYLSWPTVAAVVTRSCSADLSGVVTSRDKVELIYYRFDYAGKTHEMNRTGLFIRMGFAPKVLEGEAITVSICPLSVGLSCPDRKLFNLIVLGCFQLLFAGLILVFLTA